MNSPTSSAKARVFISYKRNMEPDHSLASQIFSTLQNQGQSVFIDLTLTIGEEWAKTIEEMVRCSNYLIVLLTAASSASEMVKGELEIARDEAAKSGKGPHILPVRVAFKGPLPYPISAWLDPLQYALWESESDTERILQELSAAITGATLSSSGAKLPDRIAVRDSPPFYSAPLPSPGGALDADDPWYIRRISDDLACRTISQQGVTLVIKGSRQMGKTSLMVRTVGDAMKNRKRCALIDFQILGKESLTDSPTFFRRFAGALIDNLETADIALSWQAGLADSQNLSKYMEKEVLGRIEDPIVLAIDEADFLFQAAFSSDFFGMLRAWHNRRADPVKKKLWKKLDLLLVTSTEPNLFIERAHESPFNVGEIVRLSDFNTQQVRDLNALHGSPLVPNEVDQIYNLLHGQPFLTRKAFYIITADEPLRMSIQELMEQASDEGGPFGDHLRSFFLSLLNFPDLAAALKQVTLGRGCGNNNLAYRLESAGLVRIEDNKLIPRCLLYERYFRERL